MRNSGTLKFLQTLKNKKQRQAHQRFIVEGRKDILEAITSGHKIDTIWATTSFGSEIRIICAEKNIELEIVGEAWLERAGNFKSNNTGIALLPFLERPQLNIHAHKWYLLLSDINDPGNLGTIIRIANWYSWGNIICSENTVDLYNPKVIASSKGSIFKVNVYYAGLNDFIAEAKNTLKIYAADMSGIDIHHLKEIEKGGMLILGSESHGIPHTIADLVDLKITIPSFGSAESLNVAMAAGIVIDNFVRILKNQ